MKLCIAIGAIWRGCIQHTLAHETSEWLTYQVHAHVPSGLGEESGIEQVHHRMFDATDVEIYSPLHPIVDDLSGEW